MKCLRWYRVVDFFYDIRQWFHDHQLRVVNPSRVEDVLGHAVSAIEAAFERLEAPVDLEDVMVAREYLVAATQILDHV